MRQLSIARTSCARPLRLTRASGTHDHAQFTGKLLPPGPRARPYGPATRRASGGPAAGHGRPVVHWHIPRKTVACSKRAGHCQRPT
jgi:hypothetical protein